MEDPPKDFLTYHFSYAVPYFVQSKLEGLIQTVSYFNFAGLIKNLFVPYKRLVAKEKTSLFDRISFNVISSIIGACVRIVLFATGILGIILSALYDIFAIVIYMAIPAFSYPQYLDFQNNTFFESDLEDPAEFTKKLTNTNLFKQLSLFFEEDFVSLFENLPKPTALGIKRNIKPSEIILTLLKNWPSLQKFLEQKIINLKQFELLINYLADHLEKTPKRKSRPIGQMLNFGYTNTLDQFSTELTNQYLPSSSTPEFLTIVEKVLTRPQKNNVLFVGEPGVGKHTALQNLAAAIQRSQLPGLSGRRVMLLDTIALGSYRTNLIEVKANLEALLEEAKNAGNIILAIDQIDRIASPQDERMDLSEVLISTLTDNSLPIIGITTTDDFNKYLRPNANLLRLFEKINIEQTPPEQTTSILIGRSLAAFNKEKVATTFSAILEIVQKSERLMPERMQPEKSIILLQDALLEAKARKIKLITPPLVDEIIAKTTKTPVGKITQTEAQKLKNLEVILHQRIIGQDEAIIEIARAMRRARSGIETGTRPIGSFLFLGPTGVGKTETAKALAQSYFGREDRMVRLDMSEFQDQKSTAKLIGDTQTLSPGRLTSLIRENPFGLLLVDEFEKASPQVHNLFLQILDEGFLTDAFGKRVSFDNVIIIATSNAGAEFIREQVTSGQIQGLPKKVVNFVLQKGLFSPELINRFDGVVVYQPLSQQQVIQVTALMLQILAKELKDSKNINLEITNELAQMIAQKGFDAEFGARPIRRLIQDRIEDGIAKMIIENQAKNGDTIPAATLLSFLS